ncbi:hypothetical protein PR202_gb08890 [Eleusine coracana subsp. coracana]|uniref:Galectin domain-containing protein n=1 Tax=Eleusine coracana subsp. coracana TaxID=191504 RepID=A0AAV5EDG6_ELECO|nr:hypothetical protein PR202_gb08890 [Eleusine coracana subsp. coracana]
MTPEKRGSNMWVTKKFTVCVLVTLFSLLIVRHLIVTSSESGTSWYQIFHGNPMELLKSPLVEQENITVVMVASAATDASTSNSLDSGNSSPESLQWLDTWNQLTQLANITNGLPHASEAISDARTAWENLTTSVQNASSPHRQEDRLCPYSIRSMNASKLETEAFTVDIPCGLIVGSSVTLIGTPGSLSGNFWIDLIGIALPGESEKPIVLHYNVRLTGDKITQDPVIVQSTFTGSNGWGSEDRCPCTNCNNATEGTSNCSIQRSCHCMSCTTYETSSTVDNLERCNAMVGKQERNIVDKKRHPAANRNDEPSTYFPFKQGYLAIATLRVGLEGIHMTVDGKHVTSFTYRMNVDLLIGIFSTANNFKRRMAIRRTWMQYDAVRQGVVAVRFFVGLTSAVSAKYLLKTDDDAFVRVDEIQSSIKQLNVTHGLLYGRINSDSAPHRNPESKWYISQEEWPEEKYPPWAHGPGYVVSQDIAMTIKAWYKTTHLKMFKLEDVAMGIWVNDMKKGGLPVRYETDVRINIDGCKDGYIVAHYQEPRRMLCMWENLLRTNEAACCNTN